MLPNDACPLGLCDRKVGNALHRARCLEMLIFPWAWPKWRDKNSKSRKPVWKQLSENPLSKTINSSPRIMMISIHKRPLIMCHGHVYFLLAPVAAHRDWYVFNTYLQRPYSYLFCNIYLHHRMTVAETWLAFWRFIRAGPIKLASFHPKPSHSGNPIL